MEKRLIFLDIDGTLTEPGKNVPPPSAVEAIRRAQACGHKVVLCSGRNYGMLSPLLRFGFDGLAGCSGGYIEYGGQVVYDHPMTPRQQEQVLAVFQENGVYRTIGGRNHSYTDEGFKEFLAENAHSTANSELLRWREQIERELDIRPMSEYDGEPIYGLAFMSRGMDRLKRPMEMLKDAFNFCIQETDACGIVNGEIISRAFNKGTAVIRLCEYLDIPVADTIAFGDSMNDLEMLQTAGLGICMANGSQALKKIARHICPSVKEDGLYKAFEKLGLI
ncbi:MAG: HAD family hydrolase [Lachnospiraceae bacterium]|nr:HAD family hydrolase [Lachnospiraceae bacterium]